MNKNVPTERVSVPKDREPEPFKFSSDSKWRLPMPFEFALRELDFDYRRVVLDLLAKDLLWEPPDGYHFLISGPVEDLRFECFCQSWLQLNSGMWLPVDQLHNMAIRHGLVEGGEDMDALDTYDYDVRMERSAIYEFRLGRGGHGYQLSDAAKPLPGKKSKEVTTA